jgi:hypothetical protein
MQLKRFCFESRMFFEIYQTEQEKRCSFGMQTVRHVLSDNLNGPNARLNARLQHFLTQIQSRKTFPF